MSERKIIEVVPQDGEWAVSEVGKSRSHTFKVKYEAVKFATQKAKGAPPSQVTIKKPDGGIEEERTFGG